MLWPVTLNYSAAEFAVCLEINAPVTQLGRQP